MHSAMSFVQQAAWAVVRSLPLLGRAFTTTPGTAGKGKRKVAEVLYAFHCGAARVNRKKAFQTYKVGKTIDLERRIRPYRTIYPQGKVHHTVPSSDIDTTERWLHDALKASGYHVEKEIFEVPEDVLKETMNVVVAFHHCLQKRGKDAKFLRRLSEALIS
jgi:hypothetical protein